MDWVQAQSAARGGKKVARGSWPDTRVVIDSHGTLQVTDARGFGSSYSPSEDDRKATDWRAVDDADYTAALELAASEHASGDDSAKAALSTSNAQLSESGGKAAPAPAKSSGSKPAVEGSKR